MPFFFQSATRISLLLLTLTICVGVTIGKISEDTFKTAALMVFTAFFSMKSNATVEPGDDDLNGK